ncbi:hypothetical protein AB1Y20_005985 [Prymnesium parvum]|uniref:AB hydrolase-1 domain-containing protein n=1 Tax=Prymnesium parvum TaxID=97485 RepID=A0AB34J392_PRYPA
MVVAAMLRGCGGRMLQRRMSTVASGTRAINGFNMFYMTNGERGMPLLCMPGALGTAETDFLPQLEHLADTFQVVSYDPRGYGKSRPPVRDFPLDFYQRDADDAAALMAALGHEQYGVMGWSDGAISSVLLSAKYRPQVKGLVMFGGNAYFTQSDVDAFEATRDIEKNWSKRMKETHIPTYGDDLQPMWSAAVDAWAGIYRTKGGDVCMEEAKSLTCPTLVLHGAKDPICLIDHPHWFKENIKDAQLHILPDGKHNLHIRYAEEVNALVRNFFTTGKAHPQRAFKIARIQTG